MARKVVGITFIAAAVIGLIFSLAGIVLVWWVKAPLTDNLSSTLDLIDTTLEATSSGLTVVDETFTQSVADLSSLENTVKTASSALEESVPMLDSVSTLLSESIPEAIDATQTGLTSLNEAAGTLESSLRLITSIPFLPIEAYEPEVSITDALDEVSLSLDAIPESLSEMDTSMNTSRGNLIMISAQTNIIARNISELKENLYEIQSVFDQYQEVIATLQEQVRIFRENLYLSITISAWFFTVIFIWLGIAQIALLTQGLERVEWKFGGRSSIPVEALEEEKAPMDTTEEDSETES